MAVSVKSWDLGRLQTNVRERSQGIKAADFCSPYPLQAHGLRLSHACSANSSASARPSSFFRVSEGAAVGSSRSAV